MYTKFYRLRENPFTLLPDPGFLYLSERHSTAAALLEYGLVSQAGITVITGSVGCGKTTLIQHLIKHMRSDVTVGLLTNTHPAFGDLLDQVLLTFGVELQGRKKAENYHAFAQFLGTRLQCKRRAVLIVDEAQNMQLEALEELRLLSNVNAGKELLLQLILVGQPQLWEKLRDPALEQFVQRVSIDYVLEPLDSTEIGIYIRHRLHIAGCDEPLFDDEAVRIVAESSHGIPRLVNMLCDRALVYGYAKQVGQVDGTLMQQVIDDRAKGGLFVRESAAAVVKSDKRFHRSPHNGALSLDECGKIIGNIFPEGSRREPLSLPRATAAPTGGKGEERRTAPPERSDSTTVVHAHRALEGAAADNGAEPFALVPDPARFYSGAGYAAAVWHLHKGIVKGVSLGVLVAASGMGKTLVLRRLAQAECPSIRFVGRYAGFARYGQILQAACTELGLLPDGSREEELEAALLQGAETQAVSGCRLVLLVDDAHRLPSGEGKRLISLVSGHRDRRRNLQLVLAGLPGLKDQVVKEVGRQRNALRPLLAELAPMDMEQSANFIRWQLQRGAAVPCGFSPESVWRIARYGGGVPWLINALCRYCLRLARLAQRPEVTLELVDRVAEDLFRSAAQDADAGTGRIGKATDEPRLRRDSAAERGKAAAQSAAVKAWMPAGPSAHSGEPPTNGTH